MKNILVLAQKGGVGKTLLADELAYSMDRTGTPYNFYEFDSQEGNRHISNERDDAIVSIIDTPGVLTDDIPDMTADAAVIIVPTRASATDQPALMRTRRLIATYAPETPVVLVLNYWNRYSNTAGYIEWLESTLRNEEILLAVSQSEAIPQSTGLDESVTTYAPRNRAAVNVREFTNAVRELLGVEKEADLVLLEKKR